MRHSTVRRVLSEELDGVPLPKRAARHLDACSTCRVYRDRLQALRSIADALPTEAAPDFVGRVMRALPRSIPIRRTPWLSPAVGVVAGMVIGVVLGGGISGPGVSLAGRLPEELVARQALLPRLSAAFSIIERIRPGAERTYSGDVHFESPEYLALSVEQISGPEGWQENSWTLLVDATTSLATEPFPCPALGGCLDSPQSSVRVVGRDPFSASVVAPLDVVIPSAVLKEAEEPFRLPSRTVADRDAVGFEVTAAQARPLLDAYFGTGNWRQVHDTDLVSIWLDAEHLTPLLVLVTAADTHDRAAWAARRGYEDGLEPYLTIAYRSVSFEPVGRPIVEPPSNVTERNSGFTPFTLPAPIDPGMPLVSSGRIDGLVDTEIWAWSDGRAWLRLDRTQGWPGPGLFGNSGQPVRARATTGQVVYQAGDGSKVFVHSDEYDAVVTGSAATEQLAAAAGSLPGPHLPVPGSWPEVPVADEVADDAYLPVGLDGFGDPILHSVHDVMVVDLFGGGERWARITQRSADRLPPPLDPDARAVSVRGGTGRYSPAFGVLEWLEDSTLFTIEAPGLSGEAVIEIAVALAGPDSR